MDINERETKDDGVKFMHICDDGVWKILPKSGYYDYRLTVSSIANTEAVARLMKRVHDAMLDYEDEVLEEFEFRISSIENRKKFFNN